RKARDEGFGAVDRIQHPDILGVLALVAEFLADNAMLGKIGLDQPPHHGFGGAVGFGYRIEIVAGAFVVDGERGSKERQDGLAGGGREAADEGGKIDDRHDYSLGSERGEVNDSCLAQSGKSRTDNGHDRRQTPVFFSCESACESARETVHFLTSSSITNSRAW